MQSDPILGSSVHKTGIDQAVIAGSLAQLKTFGITDNVLNSIVMGGSSSAINENISLSRFGKRFHSFCLNS